MGFIALHTKHKIVGVRREGNRERRLAGLFVAVDEHVGACGTRHDIQTERGLFQIDFLVERLYRANLQRGLRGLESRLLYFAVVADGLKVSTAAGRLAS